MNRPSPRPGFTLVELLVVVAIIAVLIALLMPALGRAKYQAKLAVCGSQLRQIAIGMVSYVSGNEGWYPVTGNPRTYTNYLGMGQGKSAPPLDDIRPLIRPYFGNDSRFQAFVCPLTRELFAKGFKEGLGMSYALYPNSFGRGAITGLSGGAYQVTIDSLDHSRIKKKINRNFTLSVKNVNPQYNLIAGDICQYWQFNPPTGPVLNHMPPGSDYQQSHNYTNAYAWVSDSSAGSANFAREDGSVKLYDGISNWTRNDILYYGLSLGIPKDEAE